MRRRMMVRELFPDSRMIGGRTFKVDRATMLDSRLAVGVNARVEYTIQADGALKAKEIETPRT